MSISVSRNINTSSSSNSSSNSTFNRCRAKNNLRAKKNSNRKNLERNLMLRITVAILLHPPKTTTSRSPLKSKSSQDSETLNTKIANHMTTKTKKITMKTTRITQAVLTTMLSPSPLKKRTFSSERKPLLTILTALKIQTLENRYCVTRLFSHRTLSFKRNSSKPSNKIFSNSVEAQIRKKISDSTFRIFYLLKKNKKRKKF